MKNGAELFEEVFAEEIEANGDLHLSEIQELDDVEDYDDDIYNNEGWYNYHSVTFKYKNKHYNFEYKRHTADNVCDSHWDMESFSEVVLENAVDMVFEGEVVYEEFGEKGRYEVDSGTAYLSEYLQEFEGKKIKIEVTVIG